MLLVDVCEWVVWEETGTGGVFAGFIYLQVIGFVYVVGYCFEVFCVGGFEEVYCYNPFEAVAGWTAEQEFGLEVFVCFELGECVFYVG